MSDRPSQIPRSHTANIVKRSGVYHLLMLVEGRWLETGITSRKLLEVTEIADREFKNVHLNAPMDAPPPLPEPAKEKDAPREGAIDTAAKSPASETSAS